MNRGTMEGTRVGTREGAREGAREVQGKGQATKNRPKIDQKSTKKD